VNEGLRKDCKRAAVLPTPTCTRIENLPLPLTPLQDRFLLSGMQLKLSTYPYQKVLNKLVAKQQSFPKRHIVRWKWETRLAAKSLEWSTPHAYIAACIGMFAFDWLL
jgi:hypothetical protein